MIARVLLAPAGLSVSVCLPYLLPYLSMDSSEWMRNGDYSFSRMEAEIEAGALLRLVCVCVCVVCVRLSDVIVS